MLAQHILRRARCPARRACVIGLAGVLLLASPAWADTLTERLEQLVESGRYEAAHELAHVHRADYEGDPRFDFYYGVAAIETDHLGEAVFALRRALAARPGPGVHFHLARAWLRLGEDPLARKEFERILAADPPAPLRARVERYLHTLDGRAQRYGTAIRGHVEIGGGHDSNVTAATDAESVDLAGTVVELDDDHRARSGDFSRIAGELRVSRPLRPGFNLFAEADAWRRDHAELDDYETARAQVRGGIVLREGDLRTELAARGRRFWLGGEHYRDTAGLDARLRYAFSDQHVAQLAAGFFQLRHTDGAQEPRDADLATLSAGTARLWQLPLRPTVSLFLLYGDQRARADETDGSQDQQSKRAAAERELAGAGAELELRVAPRWQLAAGLSFRRSDYPEVDPRFEQKRRDKLRSGVLNLSWYPDLAWRVRAQLRRSVNDSSIEFYDYERDVAELGLRYQF